MRARLHRAGLRFRVHYRPVATARAEADIAFPRKKLVVQIDGCFWHGCPIHATYPTHNAEWWRGKLAANIQRDSRVDAVFSQAGWQVIRFWEHEDIGSIVASVIEAVGSRT